MDKIKVLVVDDSPTQLKLMTQPFQNKYHVITASDGEEALAKARADRPALIVLDIIMPKQNGFQVCRKIKKDDELKNTKVILLTNKVQESDRYWGMKQGADAFLTKPFDENELMATVEKLLSEGSENHDRSSD